LCEIFSSKFLLSVYVAVTLSIKFFNMSLLSDYYWVTSWQERGAVLECRSSTSGPGEPGGCVEVLSCRSQASTWWTQQRKYLGFT